VQGGYLTIGDWRGAPVRLHWTLPIGAYLFGQGRFAPGSWLGFFLVVLLHEIGHARVVRRYGLRVVSIDVHALGGACRWAGEPTPVQRARIACGGVNVQVVLLFATVLALWLLGPAGTPVLDQLAGAFTVVNGWILVLNLIPVHPLDGVEIWKLPGLLRAQSQARLARANAGKRREAARELARLDAADRRGPSRDTAAAVEAKIIDLARERGPDQGNDQGDDQGKDDDKPN
jgi:Zn-dependent protease